MKSVEICRPSVATTTARPANQSVRQIAIDLEDDDLANFQLRPRFRIAFEDMIYPTGVPPFNENQYDTLADPSAVGKRHIHVLQSILTSGSNAATNGIHLRPSNKNARAIQAGHY